jgi:hypothetical protein
VPHSNPSLVSLEISFIFLKFSGCEGNSIISRDRIGERRESGSSATPIDLGGEREEALGVRVFESH